MTAGEGRGGGERAGCSCVHSGVGQFQSRRRLCGGAVSPPPPAVGHLHPPAGGSRTRSKPARQAVAVCRNNQAAQPRIPGERPSVSWLVEASLINPTRGARSAPTRRAWLDQSNRPTSPRRSRAPPPSPAKRHSVNSTRVTAGEGRGEGERAGRQRRIPTEHRRPDKFSNLSHEAARLLPLPQTDSRSTDPV